MTESIRFPLTAPSKATPNGTEASLVIDLLVFEGPGNLVPGGPADYTSIAAWKLDTFQTASPFCTVVIEITSDTAMTLGNGTTEMIGLYGCIGDPTSNTSQKFLLGALGIGLGNKFPQIPLPADPDATGIIGFAQVVSLVALYDGLAIGSINGNTAVPAGEVIWRARPVRRRDFGG